MILRSAGDNRFLTNQARNEQNWQLSIHFVIPNNFNETFVKSSGFESFTPKGSQPYK
jgi:hypothetical protein